MMTFKQQVKNGAISCQGGVGMVDLGGLVDLYGGMVDLGGGRMADLDGDMADLDGDMADKDISTDHKKDLCYPHFSK
jgi:hypothetical protein